jgi:hypothetical protein
MAVYLAQDEGTVLADSYRITQGAVMYRDFFEFQGPVFYHVYAGLFGATGPSMGAARLLHLLTVAAGTALLAALVARLAGRAAGAGAGLLHAALLLPQWPFTYPHWMAESFALGALLLLTAEEVRPRAEVAAGALLAAALLTIQSVGVPVLVACVGVLVAPGLARRSWREALLRPARLLLGVVAVLAPVALCFLARGALGALVDAMFVWPMGHYRAGNTVPYGDIWRQSFVEQGVLGEPWAWLARLGIVATLVLPFFALAGAAATLLRARVDFGLVGLLPSPGGRGGGGEGAQAQL